MLRVVNGDDISSVGRHDETTLPPWPDCDLFCIHDYAAAGRTRCGWRGRLRDAHNDKGGERLVCPSCGCATLLRIPLAHIDEGGR